MPEAGETYGHRQTEDAQDLATTDQASIEFWAWFCVFVFQPCWHTFNPREVFMFLFQPSKRCRLTVLCVLLHLLL